jgi:outer membrane protein
MRICKRALVGLLVLMFSTPVLAADIVKLGYFDMQRVIDRSEMGRAGLEQFKHEADKVRKELEAKRDELQALDGEIKKKELIWSEDVKKAKFQEFLQKKTMFERLVREANLKLSERERSLLRPIKNKAFDVIERIGKEEGYTMILEMSRSGLAYAPRSLELTDRVIKELNELAAKEPSGQFSFPKQ